MKKILTGICVLLASLVIANCKKPVTDTATKGEVWNCDFKGTNKDAKGATAQFNWKVVWTETGANSTIVGTGADSDGTSSANGTCEGKTCKIREEYMTGEAKGKIFNWEFSYTDAETKNENVYLTAISGTYIAEKDKADTGTLTAKADCKH